MNQYFKTLQVGSKSYQYYSLKELEKKHPQIKNFPKSIKILVENLIRHLGSSIAVTEQDVEAICQWGKKKEDNEISFHPARVLMQDFTGVPAVVDLAVMRDAMKNLGGDPKKINPLTPVDLVIDHSVSVDHFGQSDSFKKNVSLEYQRNLERYVFLRWGQESFNNFRVVPPGTGICHQVNLEYLGQVVWTKDENGQAVAFPDTLVGTDSHTTMINGASILGWGVGGIEAEAAMLGQPITMLIPEVVGFKLTGELPQGSTATDMVLTVTQMLRKKGVVGKFVEFYGPGLKNLALADRATLANMAPEYGATCGFFPVDAETIEFLNFSGRDPQRVQLVEAYAKAQGLWREDSDSESLMFSDTLELDLAQVEPCLAGPRRPQDRVVLTKVAQEFEKELQESFKISKENLSREIKVEGESYPVKHGDVVIAAITSCTNTSNPSVMLAAGMVARKANELGMKVKPWVKTSLAPGSQVVTEYLTASGLQKDLDAMGFNLVGYGCTTCIGNSGPLPEKVSAAIQKGSLVACSVLSGNRNFEGRVNPDVQANYLASPPLVVMYALAGSIRLDVFKDPIGVDKNGKNVFFKDLWPTRNEVLEVLRSSLTREMFVKRYKEVFKGDSDWQKIQVSEGLNYDWNAKSTFIKNPPYFDGMKKEVLKEFKEFSGARILAMLGDSVTTDHISPAGDISAKSPAAKYLMDHGITKQDFNSYGSRRGNHEVMMRGTFANIRIKNEMLSGIEGGYTRYWPSKEEMSIYDAAMKYQKDGTALAIVAGKEYGTGSSRDWAAKGPRLLGIGVVVAESFERIHRSNLIGMGVLPLQFMPGMNRKSLKLTGEELLSFSGYKNALTPKMSVDCRIQRPGGEVEEIKLLCRIDTQNEVEYFRNGGILHYVLRNLTTSH